MDVGWSCIINGLCLWSTGDVCWLWTVIHRFEEAERQVHRENAPEMILSQS